MAYRVDDGIDTWPESIRAGTAALGLYLRCGAWICRAISGGLIADAVVPAEVAAMYGTKEWVTKLCDVGLWEHVADGYADRRYFDLNPRPERVAEQRKAKRVRQERWLESQRRPRDASLTPTQDASLTIAPPPPKYRRGGRPRAAPIPPAEQCPHHRGQPITGCGGCRADALARESA